MCTALLRIREVLVDITRMRRDGDSRFTPRRAAGMTGTAHPVLQRHLAFGCATAELNQIPGTLFGPLSQCACRKRGQGLRGV